jgi:hypothetical protein
MSSDKSWQPGMSSEDVEDAHRRDMAEERRLRDLKRAIDEFLADPPTGAHQSTIRKLGDAALDIWDDILAIQRRWD